MGRVSSGGLQGGLQAGTRIVAVLEAAEQGELVDEDRPEGKAANSGEPACRDGDGNPDTRAPRATADSALMPLGGPAVRFTALANNALSFRDRLNMGLADFEASPLRTGS